MIAVNFSRNFGKKSAFYYEIAAPLRIIQIDGRYFASFDSLSSLLGIKLNPQLIVSVYASDESLSKDGKLPSVSIQVE